MLFNYKIAADYVMWW